MAGNDGLLVMDRNHDGVINNGSELFGMGTVLANGKRATDGYVALAAEDTNHDGKIDSHDAHWKELKVWVDGNHDGKTDAGELKTLDEIGIASLDLNATKNGAIDNGNLVGLVSSYTTTDGKQHQMADVWFAKDVQPQTTHDDKPTVSLHDVLAPATTLLLAGATEPVHDAAKTGTPPDAHLAAVDRKLAEEEELRRNNHGGQWI